MFKKKSKDNAAVGIIGGADGPTSIFISDGAKPGRPLKIKQKGGRQYVWVGRFPIYKRVWLDDRAADTLKKLYEREKEYEI